MGPRLQPRKSWYARPRQTLTRSFNGAATLQPRKFLPHLEQTRPLSPLQWGRDSSAAEIEAPSARLPRAYELQWGRDSSAAEMFPGASVGSGFPLQWGRDSSAAEIRPDRGATCHRGQASMGPRLFSRGNPRLTTCRQIREVASMGPRLFSRGNHRLILSFPVPEKSHVLIGAATFSRGNYLPTGLGA